MVDQLWECNFIKGNPSYGNLDSIPFIFHTASKGYAGDYLIDICTKKGLEKKLNEISKEAEKIVEIISKNRKLLEDSALKDAEVRHTSINDNSMKGKVGI